MRGRDYMPYNSNMPRPYAVVFSGVPGVSKSPIAHYLSCEFALPVLNTDQIRFEVREDWRLNDATWPTGIPEYTRRLRERLGKLLTSGTSFIFDGSQDRMWGERRPQLVKHDFDWCMIGMEPSEPYLRKLYADTDRADWARDNLTHYLEQHRAFMAEYGADVTLEIGDDNFDRRLVVAADGLRQFLQAREDT